MPDRCVAQYCSNTPNNNVSLHQFPKNQANSWRRFIRTKRANWHETSTSHLCSAHFTLDCFENYQMFKAGHATKLKLKKDAVPTIHAEVKSNECEDDTPNSKLTSSVRKKESR